MHTKRLYTGQLFDESTGLYYYGARYYDVAIGRFISPDTLVPGAGNLQNLNRFSYAANSPLGYADPTGHTEEAFTREEIESWNYDEQITELLMQFLLGGTDSVCWDILLYVRSNRPIIEWGDLGDGALGVAAPRLGGGYHITLDRSLSANLWSVQGTIQTAGLLAHEIRHAMWNNMDSLEQEYVAFRTQGLAVQEIMAAMNFDADQTYDMVGNRALVEDALNMAPEQWMSRYPNYPVNSGWRYDWQASSWLVWGPPIVNMLRFVGVLGHPFWQSNRYLGAWR